MYAYWLKLCLEIWHNYIFHYISTYALSYVCADLEPVPPVEYQRHRGRVEGINLAPSAQCRRKSAKVVLDGLCLDIEWLVEGVMDDGLKNLNKDMIIICFQAPNKWWPIMSRITIAVEVIWQMAWGDVDHDDVDSTKEETKDESLEY